MTAPARHVVVTGASGFVGSRLVTQLLSNPAFADARFSLNDLAVGEQDGPRVRVVAGDFCDPEVRQRLIDGRADIVFHLAGVLGGTAEADPAQSRRINVDGTLSLFEALYDPAAPPRLVFASSIAVFGTPMAAAVDDETRVNPTMVYGAHKAMMEIAVEQASARGWLDGIAVRLPGIVARRGADARLKSAFLNRLFEVHADGGALTLPVSPDGTTWLLSTAACIDALVHAALIPVERLGRRRTLTLPAQNVRFSELVTALRERFPDSAATIDYAPEPALEEQFGRQPPLSTPLADALGFRHDGSVAALVARAL